RFSARNVALPFFMPRTRRTTVPFADVRFALPDAAPLILTRASFTGRPFASVTLTVTCELRRTRTEPRALTRIDAACRSGLEAHPPTLNPSSTVATRQNSDWPVVHAG